MNKFKKITLGLLGAALLATGFYSCSNENEVIESKESQDFSILSRDADYPEEPVLGHIYFATWSEWGRTSKSCKKFGLCNFVDCWACCSKGNVIVDCKTGSSVKNSGTIYLDDNGEGFLFIKLDPNYNEQAEAIQSRKTLFIDEDLYSENCKLSKGEYLFDLNIGSYGGYKIKASLL